MNKIAYLEFELTSYNVAVQYISHYAMGTPLKQGLVITSIQVQKAKHFNRNKYLAYNFWGIFFCFLQPTRNQNTITFMEMPSIQPLLPETLPIVFFSNGFFFFFFFFLRTQHLKYTSTDINLRTSNISKETF